MEYDSSGLAYDVHLEESALGCILLQPERIKEVLSTTGLKGTSFYVGKNKTVFDTVVKLFEEGKPPNETLVSSQLNGAVPKDYIFDLTASVPSPAYILEYAERLVELEQWRARREAALALKQATEERDLEAFAKARAKLERDEIHVNSSRDPKELGEQFKDFLKGEEVEAFELPYPKFNERMAGGLRRKQMTLLGGWSSHGKSVVMDQMLEHFALAGHKCHLYINEMGLEDRVARSISRNTEINYQNLVRHKINEQEKALVELQIDEGCPWFSITECAGWSINELAYDIKSRDFDVIGIDILHLFDYDSEIELARISRLLNRTAKQANCHVIATVHLNEFRANDTIRPRPVLRDIRGSGMLKNDADNVMFIYRNQDPSTGDPLPDSFIYTSKVRNGQMGYVPLLFKEQTFEFEEI